MRPTPGHVPVVDPGPVHALKAISNHDKQLAEGIQKSKSFLF